MGEPKRANGSIRGGLSVQGVRLLARTAGPNYRRLMRWLALFDDLEAELDRERRHELLAESGALLRTEWARTGLAERLGAHLGRRLGVRLAGGFVLHGMLLEAGPHWLLLEEGPGQVLVPAAAVVAVSGLGKGAVEPAGEVARRLGLSHALRALARDRAFVRVCADGVEFSGTIDRVGEDHFDLATHDSDQWRRSADVSGVWSVSFAHLRYVRSGQ